MTGPNLRGEAMKSVEEVPLLLSQRLDDGVLSRFWTSLNQPLKPAIQCWTTIPIFPARKKEITRVIERDVRFMDLNRLGKTNRR
jgi:hypothetical protein